MRCSQNGNTMSLQEGQFVVLHCLFFNRQSVVVKIEHNDETKL